jgi:2'-5' RNA ligase
MPAHITLVFPFLPSPVDSQSVEELATIFRGIHPFEIAFASTGRFRATLFLAPTPRDPILELIEAVVRRWPHHAPYGGTYDEVVPHLTVADRVDDHAVLDSIDAQIAPHLPVTTRATTAALMEPDRQGVWRMRAALPFLIA